MAAEGILKVNAANNSKPPTHAWDWETFRELIEAEDDITFRSPLLRSVTPDEAEDESLNDSLTLSWDNSPEQYDLVTLNDEEDEELTQALEPRKLFNTSNDDSSEGPETNEESDAGSLTVSTSDSEVFPNENSTPRTIVFNRNAANRRGRIVPNYHQTPTQIPIPSVPDQVHLDHPQLLHRVLPLGNPLVPEAVQLGPKVQHLNQALEVLQQRDDDLEDQDNQEQQTQDRPRRSSRLDINYKTFDAYGEK